MRQATSNYATLNLAGSFGGMNIPGATGSNLNQAQALLDIGPGMLGMGGSADQGGGGGGFGGGGGSGAHLPGGGGGKGGTGGFAGGAGTVGGPYPRYQCQKNTTAPPSDIDDNKDTPNPSPESSSSGLGAGQDGVNPEDMTANPCKGGTSMTPPRLRGKPDCSRSS